MQEWPTSEKESGGEKHEMVREKDMEGLEEKTEGSVRRERMGSLCVKGR